jgi:SWI/SNF-related matrix-associated actin-dependent regulator 1 of chromatin subfamily A
VAKKIKTKGVHLVGGISQRASLENLTLKNFSKGKPPGDSPPSKFWPEGLTPFPHQLEAVDFALSGPYKYIFAKPGLGKTIEAALIWNKRPGLKVFYICPPFLVANTEEEFSKWCGRKPYVISDSMLAKDETLFQMKKAFGVSKKEERILFVDEAHRFKNLTAGRTKHLFKNYFKEFGRVVFMSGSPMPNTRPKELWPVLRNAAPEIFGHNFFNFACKYCGAFKGPFGWNFDGFTNRKEFKIRLTRSFMLIQKKDLLDLPPKREGILTVGDNQLPKELEGFETAIKANPAYEDIVRGDVLEFHDIENPDIHQATYLKLLGGYKLKYVIPFVEDLLENTKENILLFAVHKSVILGLKNAFKEFNPIVIDGGVPKEKRQGLVKKYQESKKHRLFIGNIQACGLGFTLTKAERVIFIEFSWVPDENNQAADRAHRIGQTKSVLVQYTVLKGSVDQRRMESLLRKTKQSI